MLLRSLARAAVRAVRRAPSTRHRASAPSKRKSRAVEPLHAFAPRRGLFRPSPVLLHGGFERQPPATPDDIVNIRVIDRKGDEHPVQAKVGDNLLYLFHHLQESSDVLYLEGACEASLACSTCHVILDDDSYDKLPEPCESEDDMLDMASCLSDTSRLGCQIVLSKDLEGMTVKLPAFSKNFYVDGHIPQPH